LFLRLRSKFRLKPGKPPFVISFMEHKGIRYELLQTLHPEGWKWVAHIGHTKQITGFNTSKNLAVYAAKRAIEKALSAEDKRERNLF
jgi:hypothetical protein